VLKLGAGYPLEMKEFACLLTTLLSVFHHPCFTVDLLRTPHTTSHTYTQGLVSEGGYVVVATISVGRLTSD
jgi:hypothetical protein